MGEQKNRGAAVYVVTKIFRADDGQMRVPNHPDSEKATITADYDMAGRLRAAGCIGGIVRVTAGAVEEIDETPEQKKARKKAEREAKKAALENENA